MEGEEAMQQADFSSTYGTVFLDGTCAEPKLKANLHRHSHEMGVPISEFVRRRLTEALRKGK
jgi:hypothetical protein